MNNKLTESRSRLREAAKNYQIALAWYQSNIDSPAALQTWDAATSEFMSAIGNRETDIIADLLDEIYELQERRKADSAEPIYQNYPDDGWSDCSKEPYEKLTELGCRTRIVYAAPQPAPQPSVGFVDATGTDCECVCPECKHEFSIQFEY